MKLALFAVAALAVVANELVLGVLKEQDAMKASSAGPEGWRATLAELLAPVLELLYLVALPLALVALVCVLCVIAPRLALVLVLLLLITATRWVLRR